MILPPSCLNNKHLIHAVFLDFSKAFDKVAHRKLCYKLSLLGIRGPIIEWIKDFLSNRTQKLLMNGEESNPVDVANIWCFTRNCAGASFIFVLYK